MLPVSLVATVLLRDDEGWRSELELKAAVFTLVRELEAKGAHVYIPRTDHDDAVVVGLRMLTLRRLVVEADGRDPRSGRCSATTPMPSPACSSPWTRSQGRDRALRNTRPFTAS